ncbi:hypothetical protein CJ030_MR5G005103 [Morella rubra]|uniref:RNase H type-1 domain-containing protein n=1 Tax=Morella rubra TaxID=262757 RepID=A0A6A1VM07_9ROSI|nr:hypothetical protein CJ030_MR5G005103 [Morella rubra]
MAACICRDYRGIILHVETKRLCSIDPTVGEAEALWLGIQVASNHSWRQVLFEGDSLIVKDAVDRDSQDCTWMLESIVSNIKSQLAASPGFKCLFVPRSVGCFLLTGGMLSRVPWFLFSTSLGLRG